jgi:hypothetical protein
MTDENDSDEMGSGKDSGKIHTVLRTADNESQKALLKWFRHRFGRSIIAESGLHADDRRIAFSILPLPFRRRTGFQP